MKVRRVLGAVVAAGVTVGMAGVAAAAPAGTAVTGAAGATGVPSFRHDQGGFHSVLAYGEGETTTALDLAQAEALSKAPATFTNQTSLYNAVITKQPSSDADLSHYYKSSDFSVPTGSNVGSTQHPIAGVTVIRDKRYNVPHIYAATRQEGMYAAGYVTAQDRLFLMDVLRRMAEGSMAGLLGPGSVSADSAALGQFALSPKQLTHEVREVAHHQGADGRQAFQDIKNYVAGINGYINATKTDPALLPAEYVALGAHPRAWTLADTAAEAYLLIAQFTVAGDGEQAQAEILGALQHRLGKQHGREIYNDLRTLSDPDAMTTTTQRFPSDRTGTVKPSANPHLTPGTITSRNAVVKIAHPLSLAARSATPTWARGLARHGLGLPDIESNALLVEGRYTKSGHPVAAMGPQVGYYSPEIFDEYELHMPGIQVSGVAFPGASPYPLIGHTRSFAWTGTTALGDNADTFAEKLCNPNGSRPTYASSHYRYRGRCIAFTRRTVTETTPLAPTAPALPETITLQAESSVHGPVFGFARAGHTRVALTRATAVYHHGVRSVVAFERLAENRVHSPKQFIGTMRHFTGNENWFYVSRSHIAWFASGWFQQHAAHTNLQLPMWGTGRDDWKGFTPKTYSYARQPKSFNPRSIDPKQGYLASWNNTGARGFRASPGVWSWGRVQRVELLADPTRAAIKAGHKLTLADVVGISGNASTRDLRAVKVLPDMLRVLGKVKGGAQHTLVADLRAWLQSGAHRRATHGRSYDDHSAAVMAFDGWWRQVVRRIYDPIVGPHIMKLLADDEGMSLSQPPVSSGFFDGWQSQLSAVLQKVLGRHDPSEPKGRFCGTGSLRSCRKVLRAALASATRSLVKTDGRHPAAWRKPVLCPQQAVPTCDENLASTAGAVATPPQPFENRGTFHQAVEIR